VCDPRSALPSLGNVIFRGRIVDISLDCLAKNSYNEEKCKSQVDALYACCNEFYQKFGDDAKSASCPKASLLRLKLKQRAEDADTGSKSKT
jgi:hypothetical protein